MIPIVNTRSYELVRDRIAEIIANELPNQATLHSDSNLNASIFINRITPLTNEEMPMINVWMGSGNYDNFTQIKQDGTYIFNVDVYTSSPSTSSGEGDVLSMSKLQKLAGVVQGILMHPNYVTLGFERPFIEHREISSISTGVPNNNLDAHSITQARLELLVRVPEHSTVNTPNNIAGYDTQVKLGLTDKGYIYSGDNIPIPEPVCDPVTIEQSDGTLIFSAPSGTTYQVSDSVVSNSDNSYIENIKATDSLDLPDVPNVQSDGSTVMTPAQTPFVCTPSIANDVALRFITAHEIASGQPMNLHQKQVINNFCLMLKGVGTANKTDLLTRFVNDGTVLFPLCPTNDNDVYLPSFEIDLISGTKQGQYVNMDSSNLNVYGALADANGQYFEIFKTGQDYNLEPGYTFGYIKELCAVEVVAMFGNSTSSSDMIRLMPRSTAGGGWSYPYWNGATGIATGPSSEALGQLGVLKRASGIGEVYTTYKSGSKIVESGNNSPAPSNRSSNNMYFHTSFGWLTNHFKTRISMYCTGVQFGENEDTAFADLSQAVEYYQDNILSNNSRKWQ